MVNTNELDFAFLYRVAERSIASLRADAGAAVDNRAWALGEHLSQTLDALEKRISLSSERFSQYDQLEQMTAMHALRTANGTLEEMQEATDWIAKSLDSQLHLGVLYFIDRIARELGGDNVCITPIPDGGYGYSAFSWPFKHILKDLEEPDVISEPHPAVVSYLPHEQDSTLLTPLFAHEVGHCAVEERNLVDEVLGSKTEDFDATFLKLATDEKLRRAASLAEVEELIELKLDAWLTELLCDSLATLYLGPAYLFAFSPAVVSSGLDDFTDTHPATSLRVRQILSILSSTGWDDLLGAEVPLSRKWLKSIAAMDLASDDPIEAFCLDATREFQDEIAKVAAEHLGTAVFAAAEFHQDFEDLMAFFEQRILPVQMPDKRAADQRSIILGGWLFKLRGEAPEEIAIAIDGDEFQAFLAAALEMSFVLGAWEKK